MNRLSVRLSLAFLLTAWLGIGAMVLVVQRTLETGFRQYLTSRDSQVNPEQVTRLEAYFAANGTWVNAGSVLSGRGGGGSGSNQGAAVEATRVQLFWLPTWMGRSLPPLSPVASVQLFHLTCWHLQPP